MPLGLNWPLSLHFIDWLWAGLLFVAHLATVARALTRANRTPASRVAWVATIMLLPIVGVLAYLLLGETSIGRGRFERLRRTQSALRLPPHPPTLVPEHAAPLFDLAGSVNGLPAVGGNRIALLGDPLAPASEPMRNPRAAMEALTLRNLDEFLATGQLVTPVLQPAARV